MLFIFGLKGLQRVTLATGEGVTISHISGQEYVYIGLDPRNKGLISPPLAYHDQP